jgi:hypothetical protein
VTIIYIIVTAIGALAIWVRSLKRGKKKVELERDVARGERNVAVEQVKADRAVDEKTEAGLAAGRDLVDTPEIRKAEGASKIDAIDRRLRERARAKLAKRKK